MIFEFVGLGLFCLISLGMLADGLYRHRAELVFVQIEKKYRPIAYWSLMALYLFMPVVLLWLTSMGFTG